MSFYPEISVIIPVKNEALKIRACIEGILSQSVPVKEIIVIDSGSTDGTIEILNEFEKVKLIQIPSSQFNHGLTRNLGVSHATGEYCLLTVGDAKAADNDWIKKMIDCFTDENIGGVCGQQIVPHDTDKNPVDWFRPVSLPAIKKFHFNSAAAFDAASPADKKEACSWDDVTAMYRRDVLLKIPFIKTSFSEDMIWAREALLAGYTLVYNTGARVYHYHLENADFTYKRTFTTNYYKYKYFKLVPVSVQSNLRRWAGIFKLIFAESKLSFRQKLFWCKYNIEANKSYRKSTADFLNTLAKGGEAALDKYHTEICGLPPVPLKTSAF